MDPTVEYLLRLGDNALILGQRVSEWCGHAPALEEDIALANIALDLIGQTQLWLGLAGEIEGQGRHADDLAFLRDVYDFRNSLLVEQPNQDFAVTMMRQFLFDAFSVLQLDALTHSKNVEIAAIAAKCHKEALYHLDRSSETVIGLGDGTDISHAKMQNALDRLWVYAGELVIADDLDRAMAKAGIGVDLDALHAPYFETVRATLATATLRVPDTDFAHKGGKSGQRHSEHLGHLLTSMQWLQRAYPGAKW